MHREKMKPNAHNSPFEDISSTHPIPKRGPFKPNLWIVPQFCIVNYIWIEKCFPQKTLRLGKFRGWGTEGQEEKGSVCGDRDGLVSDSHMLG